MNAQSQTAPYALREGATVRLGNRLIEALFALAPTPTLAAISDRLTDRRVCFISRQESALILSTDVERVDIAGWRFCVGSDGGCAPEQERGYVAGYHRPDTPDSDWKWVGRINEFPIGPVSHSTALYPGFAWYRTSFDLSPEAVGVPVCLTVGGMDHQDWLDYRFYLNGVLVGSASPHGTWHAVPSVILEPESGTYAALRFDGPNVLAVQTRGLDRCLPGMHVPDAERHSVGSELVDQYVSVGPAERAITDLRLVSFDCQADADQSELRVVLESDGEPWMLAARYWLNAADPVLHKRVSVRNAGQAERVLLEVGLYEGEVDVEATGGGMGWPLMLGDAGFCGISHPAGVAQSDGRRIRLASFPGRRLAAGETYESKVAVFGVGRFVDYLERHGRRSSDLVRMFHCYGIHDIAGIEEPTHLTEKMVHRNLDVLASFRERGIEFDYYWIDAGWSNPTGDLRDFNPEDFPGGPGRVVERVRGLGMKLGLWTSPAGGPAAFYPGVANPHLSAPGAGCMAEGSWRDVYRDALLYHVRENGVRGFKFDGNAFSCSYPGHSHLPARYSVEAVMDGFIGILDAVRAECPDVFFMFYWNVQSPWWLLHGDTLYERGVLMEGSTPADAPTRLLRQSVTLSFDQAVHHSWETVPVRASDGLGVWISIWRWASYMGKEGWRDAWVMDIARGSMMCQLWGDVSLFDEEDVAFLAHISRWLEAHWRLLRHPRRILGDPWNAEPYGYAYSDGTEAAVLVYNPQFDEAEVSLRVNLDVLPGASGTSGLSVRSVYPDATESGIVDGGLVLRLAPFEVRVLHVTRSDSQSEPVSTWGRRYKGPRSHRIPCELSETRSAALNWEDEADRHSIRRALNGRVSYADQHENYTPDARFIEARDTELVHRRLEGRVRLGADERGRDLLVTVRLAREGVHWHHCCLYDIIRLTATVGETQLPVSSTPYRWHEEAGGWSWILFCIAGDALADADDIALGLDTYLPSSVDAEVVVRSYEG